MRNTVKRSVLAAVLALMMVLLMACQPAAVTPTAAPAAGPTTAPAAGATAAAATAAPSAAPEPVAPSNVTWINRLNATFVVENNSVIEELGKRTNTIIELEAPPINNYDDRRNIVMASGDIPDIIYGPTGQLYEQWANDGLIMRLDDYIDQMPNVRADVSDMEFQQTYIPSLDNGIYSIPRIQTKAADAIGYRGDWLEALGMEVPVTPAEFAAVALAMAKNDPDGNGKEDTYGISFQMEALNHRYTSSNFFSPASVPNADGTYSNIEAKPGYMDYMDWLAEMYASGAMDPEWYLNERYGESDKFAAGKVGTRILDTTTSHTMDMFTNKDILAAFPSYTHIPGPPLRNEGETISNDYWAPPYWGNWLISANPGDLDAVLRLMDYGFTDEGHILMMYGIDGIHYTNMNLDTMSRETTQEQKDLTTAEASSYLTFRHRSPGNKTWNPGQDAAQITEFAAREAYIRGETNLVDYLPAWESLCPGITAANLANADNDTERKQMITKYICGEISRADMVTFLERYNNSNEMKAIVEAITAGAPNK